VSLHTRALSAFPTEEIATQPYKRNVYYEETQRDELSNLEAYLPYSATDSLALTYYRGRRSSCIQRIRHLDVMIKSSADALFVKDLMHKNAQSIRTCSLASEESCIDPNSRSVEL